MALYIETIVRKGENQIHSVKPSELHKEGSDDGNEESAQDIHHNKRLLSVVYANGDYFIYQGKSLKHGFGLGMKCKSDRYFITDVIEKLASKAYIVVADSKIEGLPKRQQDEEDEDEHE